MAAEEVGKASSSKSQEERDAVIIKELFEDWREVVLILNDVLLWKNPPLHPALLFGITTATFLTYYTLNLGIVSSLSLSLLILVLGDYIGPMIISKTMPKDQWTSAKEKEYSKVCSNMAYYFNRGYKMATCFWSMRNRKPHLFYPISVLVLMIGIYIGCRVNNFFLLFIIETMMLLLPGLNHSGFVDKYCPFVKQYLGKAFGCAHSGKEKAG